MFLSDAREEEKTPIHFYQFFLIFRRMTLPMVRYPGLISNILGILALILFSPKINQLITRRTKTADPQVHILCGFISRDSSVESGS